MADFKEVFEKVKGADIRIEIQKSGKNKGAVKVKTSSGSDGTEALRSVLRLCGWEQSYEEFISLAQQHLTPKPSTTPKQQKSPAKLKSCVIEHPDFTDRRVYGRHDLTLLKPIRFVVQDNGGFGRIVLAHTGAPGSASGDTYALVSTASQGSGSGFTSALRSSLAGIPATKEWQEKQIDKAIQDKKAEILADFKKRNEEADEPRNLEELEEEALCKAEESRQEIAKEIAKSTMLMQCNDGLSRLLELFTDKVRGREGANEVFVQVMRLPDFPLLFCRSSRLKESFTVESTTLEDGN